jgi:hypothetical protein
LGALHCAKTEVQCKKPHDKNNNLVVGLSLYDTCILKLFLREKMFHEDIEIPFVVSVLYSLFEDFNYMRTYILILSDLLQKIITVVL